MILICSYGRSVQTRIKSQRFVLTACPFLLQDVRVGAGPFLFGYLAAAGKVSPGLLRGDLAVKQMEGGYGLRLLRSTQTLMRWGRHLN